MTWPSFLNARFAEITAAEHRKRTMLREHEYPRRVDPRFMQHRITSGRRPECKYLITDPVTNDVREVWRELDEADTAKFYEQVSRSAADAFVLADMDSKRRIVELAAEIRRSHCSDDFTADHLADGVLALLALPYSAHSDYREEWRP